MEVKDYIISLLSKKGKIVSNEQNELIQHFSESIENITLVNQIIENQLLIMKNWEIKTRIEDIKRMSFPIQNGTVGKAYFSKIDFKQLNLTDIITEDFQGLDEIGLKFNATEDSIEGVPTVSGEKKMKFLFKIEGEAEDTELNVKEFSIIMDWI